MFWLVLTSKNLKTPDYGSELEDVGLDTKV
jgi:hypothetical protein